MGEVVSFRETDFEISAKKITLKIANEEGTVICILGSYTQRSLFKHLRNEIDSLYNTKDEIITEFIHNGNKISDNLLTLFECGIKNESIICITLQKPKKRKIEEKNIASININAVDGRVFKIPYNPYDTISILMRYIAREADIHIENIKIIHQGILLCEDYTLSEIKIKDGDILFCTLSYKGY